MIQAKTMQLSPVAAYRSPELSVRMLALTCVWLRIQLAPPWAKSS